MSDEVPAPEGGEPRNDFLTRILDELVDLAQTARDWVRQEAGAVVREKIVPPLQKVGILIGAAIGAATLFAVGMIFVAVAAVVYLSQLLGVPLAFLIIGAVYLIGALVFTLVKVRSMQR